MYHAELGRFLTRDPIGYGGRDISLFSYVTSSPISHTDPTGLEKELFKRCAITVFIGHDKKIAAHIKKNHMQFQTECYYSIPITCHAQTVAAALPSLLPGAPISNNPLDWRKKKPGYDYGKDVWEATKKAAETAAKTLLNPPCCCKQVEVVVECIDDWSECTFVWPKLDPPEPFKKKKK